MSSFTRSERFSVASSSSLAFQLNMHDVFLVRVLSQGDGAFAASMTHA